MDWYKFEKEARLLAQKIDYTPDIVIGIARGGIIPAALLSKFLGVKDTCVIKMQREGEGRQISAYVLSDVSNKKVLLVEDMIETGRSLIAGKKYLEERGAEVKTACLYTMPISEIRPDYLLKEVSNVVNFPWNN
ncbi:MAG: phosphoribosyltransferase family protein [bacterium]|nr:phosphoribosyltransferase family protein [bacterium]